MEDKLKTKTEKVSAKDQILLMQRILGSYYAVKMFACYRELSLDYYQYDSAKNFKYHVRPDFVAINAKKHVRQKVRVLFRFLQSILSGYS